MIRKIYSDNFHREESQMGESFIKTYARKIELFIYIIFLCFVLVAGSRIKAGAASLTEGAERFKLDSGLNVIIKEDHSAPVVSVQIWVKTGSANETEEEAGITHLIEHMIFKGTPTRKVGEIARTIESSGGDINAYTSYDRTVYYAEIASDYYEKAVDVLLDAVQNSVFDPAELEREREVVLEEYRRSMDLPERRFNWAMFDLCYKNHPYKRPVIGYESTIRSITREDILKYMHKWYTADNMALVAVGDFKKDEALEAIKRYSKNLPDRKGYNVSLPVEPVQTSTRVLSLSSDVNKVYMDLSWHMPSIKDPSIPAFDLLETILGHGRSSRLYNKLKMEKNLVRSIDAGAYIMADPGLFSVEAELGADGVNNALDAIIEEITRIKNEPITETELLRARRIVETDFLSAMETMNGQSQTLAFFETMTGDMNKSDDYLEKLKKVTAEEIMKVADLYLTSGNLSVGIMTPEGSKTEISGDQIAGIFSAKSALYNQKISKSSEKSEEETTKVILPNGIRLIIKENHRLPLASIRIAFLGGTRLEKTAEAGISALTAKMLTRGTTTRSASEIASTVEAWAGEIEGFSGRNSFGISAELLSGDLYNGLELLADLIRNPSFPEEEIAKAREDILMDIKAKNDDPVNQLTDLFNETLYHEHPYGHPMTGTEKSVNSIKRSDLIEWYKSLAVPSNMVITVVGDVQKEVFTGKAKDVFKGLDSSDLKVPVVLTEPPLKGIREVHSERQGEQVHIMIGYLDVALGSRENAVMTLVDTALSGQGGRLFTELRDKQSLAYSVSSFRRPGLETGAFAVYLACAPDKLKTAKKALFSELEKIKKKGLSAQELEDAKRYVLGNDAIEHQTNGDQAMRMALDELYGLGYDYYIGFNKEIAEVTLEDIKETLGRILIPDGYALVTVGPKR